MSDTVERMTDNLAHDIWEAQHATFGGRLLTKLELDRLVYVSALAIEVTHLRTSLGRVEALCEEIEGERTGRFIAAEIRNRVAGDANHG